MSTNRTISKVKTFRWVGRCSPLSAEPNFSLSNADDLASELTFVKCKAMIIRHTTSTKCKLCVSHSRNTWRCSWDSESIPVYISVKWIFRGHVTLAPPLFEKKYLKGHLQTVPLSGNIRCSQYQIQQSLRVRESNKGGVGKVPIFTARCYAERGYATVCSLSVCMSVRPSVMFRYRDHIGWNTSKIITRPNSSGWPQHGWSDATGTPPKLGWNRGGVTQKHKNLQYLRNGAR